jgi:hypothetical protein
MALAFRQSKTDSNTGAAALSVTLSSPTLVGSALIAAVGLGSNNGVSTLADPARATSWNLLYEAASSEDADEGNVANVRVQIWGSFNVPAGVDEFRFVFSGGTTDRGVIVAEYTGDVFEFPNPADRVVGTIGTTAAGVGTADTGVGGTTREDDELWVACCGCDDNVTWQNPTAPFSIRAQGDIGNPAAGQIALLDDFSSSAAALRAQCDHSAGAGAVEWAITAAALRGVLQVPVTATTEPVSAEPVTEFTDYSSDAIGKFIAQLRARS